MPRLVPLCARKGSDVRHRVWYIGIGGAVLLGIGLFALRFPVFIDHYDQWGWQVFCGSGFVADLTQARDAAALDGTDLVGACESALLFRRAWTVPLVLAGALAVMAVLTVATVTSRDRPLVGERDRT